MPDHPLPDAELAKEWWGAMLLIRRFEERSSELYGSGEIAGFLHSARGEEAVVVGALRALGATDPVLSTFRAHAHALVRGTPAGEVLAELLGRAGGTSGGRGGATHVFDPARGVLGGFGIPAGHAPIAAGVALGAVAQDSGAVALCQLTLGATAEGVFAETLGLAGSWALPVVFLVTSDRDAADPLPAVTELFQRSAAWGVAGLRCDGEDVVDVWRTVREAARRARDERRPTLVEAVVHKASGGDAVLAFGNRLVREDVLSDADRSAIAADVAARVDAAVAFARASPEPAASTLYDNVTAPSA
jgi:pyruvate dehydrogenase E1 component alpha subunit